MSESNTNWSRIMSPMEEMLHDCHNKGFMIIRYAIRLCSRNMLQESEVRTALIHLQRKVPTLRLCIKQREDGKYWFQPREDANIDFEVMDASQYEKEHKDIIHGQFNIAEGPLWRTRLFPCLPAEPFQMEHLRAEFPHQYKLLLSFHHSITDGTSNIQISSLLLNILNDVVAGKTINDEEQLGYHATPDENVEVQEKVKSQLLKNDVELDSLRKFYDRVEDIEVQIMKAFPSEISDISSIETIHHDMSEEQTTKLIQKCKSEKVTMNSALCTAIHAAVVDLLKATGIENETYTIAHQQLVNLRRYWNIVSGNPLGNAICNTTMVSYVPSDINKDNFWELTREFNKEFSDLLQDMGPYKEMAVKEMEGSKELRKFVSENVNEILNYTYTTSNCVNLNKVFSGEGDHVQATHFSRCTSVRKLVSTHESHTFRGRLLYALDYGPEYISREGAQMWCDKIFQTLKEVI